MSTPSLDASILPGLVSVTFRQHSPAKIIELAARNGLRAIEWGADIHCPPGEVATARNIANSMAVAGMESCSYGSYYRAGEAGEMDFQKIIETASILQAPLIRVWAGREGSKSATVAYRAKVEEDLQRVSTVAASAGCRISLECHSRTLTDSAESTLKLLHLIPSLLLHWQPPNGIAQPQALDFLARLGPRLSNLHVFAWELVAEELIRLPLAEHAARWQTYLACASQVPGKRYALLEFVRDDSVEQFAADACTLAAWLKPLH